MLKHGRSTASLRIVPVCNGATATLTVSPRPHRDDRYLSAVGPARRAALRTIERNFARVRYATAVSGTVTGPRPLKRSSAR
jgi:hypothetical protein